VEEEEEKHLIESVSVGMKEHWRTPLMAEQHLQNSPPLFPLLNVHTKDFMKI
jgi:hypothetical protein